MNHPFIDGNKRIGLRAADVFLMLNGYELVGEKQELVDVTREDLIEFVRSHMCPYP